MNATNSTRTVVSVLLAAALVACAGESETTDDNDLVGCTGKCDGLTTEPIRQPALGSCWAESGDLVCVLIDSSPLKPGYMLVEHGPAGQGRVDEPNTPQVIGPVGSLPLTFGVGFGLNGKVEGLPHGAALVRTVTIDASHTAASPLELRVPIDLWPVETYTEEGTAYFESTIEYDVAPWTFDRINSSDTRTTGFTFRSTVDTFYLLAPASGTLTGKLTQATPIFRELGPTSVTTGGKYIFANGEMRLATPDEAWKFAPACQDSEYLPWLEATRALFDGAGHQLDADELTALDAQIAKQPCTSRTDAGYANWLALLLDRIDLFTTFVTEGDQPPAAQQTIEASESELAILDAIVALRPLSDSAEAYETFLANFEASMASLEGHPSAALIVERLIAAAPTSTKIGAYDAWARAWANQVLIRVADGDLTSDEEAALEPWSAIAPQSDGDEAWSAWFSAWQTIFDYAYGSPMDEIDDAETSALGLMEGAQPTGAGDASYQTWLSAFITVISRADAVVTDNQAEALTTLLSLKPCASADSTGAQIYDAFKSGVTEPGKQPYVAQATPSCGE